MAPLKSEFSDGALQLVGRGFRIGRRQRRKAGKARRICAHRFVQRVVGGARQCDGTFGVELLGGGVVFGNNLKVDTSLVHLAQPQRAEIVQSALQRRVLFATQSAQFRRCEMFFEGDDFGFLHGAHHKGLRTSCNYAWRDDNAVRGSIMKKRPLGKLPVDAFGVLELPVIAADILDGFRALPDLTGMSSDAMDELGIAGVIPASVLKPTDAKARLVGRALTVKNVAAATSVPEAVATGVSGMAEIEAHNLAEPGDVLVLQGLDQISNMGGMSASIGAARVSSAPSSTARCATSIMGATSATPIWSRSVSPMTGKWRVKTVAVNKPVTICGIAVNPGDLVLADETGVCFIPRRRARRGAGARAPDRRQRSHTHRQDQFWRAGGGIVAAAKEVITRL